MPNPNLTRQIRLVLQSAPDAVTLAELLALVDDFVLECSSSAPEPEVLVFHLEEELQSIHHEVVDYSSLYQIEVFLAILYHLGPILPCTSVIAWFDLVLRFALHEPKLSTIAVSHAKELIISALQKTQDVYLEKVGDFRRRFLELYLLDTFNEGSGDDVLGWAELDEDQREKRTCWKFNLEDILVKYGNERPEDFLSEVFTQFDTPSTRLQLLMLLNLYTSGPSFSTGAVILAKHPLMESLMLSLFLDNSSTVCTAGLSLIVKVLPFLAVNAREDLRAMLPKLMAVLARIMCWKERPPSNPTSLTEKGIDVEFERELEKETNPTLDPRANSHWNRLEMTFNATKSPPPSSRPYFTALYYLYPSNVLKFLRAPVQYLETSQLESPYEQSWGQAFDQDEIRRRSENLLREHVCHPLLVWRDAIVELSEPEFWIRYDTSRIISETVMLDVRNHALGLRGRFGGILPPSTEPIEAEKREEDEILESETLSTSPIKLLDLSSSRPVISLQDMINTSVALKSNVDVIVQKSVSQWPHELFPTTTPTPSGSTVTLPQSPSEEINAAHVTQAISGLQREVLLLRNELNFELWLSRENVKHIGRLYQDRILMKTAETERQGLYNKLRKYRAQVNSLEAELREHKEQASSAKHKYADWNTELQKKLKELREEKRTWISETAALRSAEKEAQDLFRAQGKLLADATKEVFDLQTQKKETQHKIDRLKDYERQIEQHIKIQRLWDDDFAKFNDRAEQIKLMQSGYKQMQLRLESLEKTQIEMEDNARVSRRQIQSLEARLAHAKREAKGSHAPTAQDIIAVFAAEKAGLRETNKKLKDEVNELKDEVEELQAMVEMLKDRRKRESEPRASPLMYG